MDDIKINLAMHNATAKCNYTIYRENGSKDYLLLFTKCDFIFYINGEAIEAKPFSVILYEPNFCQFYKSFDNTIMVNDFIHFSSDKIKDFLEEISFKTNSVFEIFDDNISNIFKEMSFLFSGNKPYKNMEMEQLLKYLLIKIKSITKSNFKNIELNKNYIAIKKELLENCAKNSSIPQICKKYAISESVFYSTYKKIFNSTPKKDVLFARLSMSKHLLLNTNLQVNEIALNCGFSNEYNYIKIFKKHFNVTPGKFRRL